MALREDELMFFVDFHCTSDSNNSLGRKKIHFSSYSPPTTIKDIKTKIEETYSVPGIVAKLQLNRVVLHDEDNLDGLNIRSGDTFSAQYYSKVDYSEVNQLIQWMEELLGLLEKWTDDNGCILPAILGSIDIEKEVKGESCLDDLTDFCFYPWMTPEKDANKYYFISKGGLNLVTRIVGILMNHPPSYLPRKLLVIENKTLCILWDISTDEHILRAIVRADGVEMCFMQLMRIESELLVFDGELTWLQTLDAHHDAFEEILLRSLGTLANLCELEDIRLTIASNKEAIDYFLTICINPLFRRSIIHRVIMIFLHLSYTHTTHEYLIKDDNFTSLVHMSWPTYNDETNLIMRFHYSVLFSNLLLVSSKYFDPLDVKFLQRVLGIVAKLRPTVIATIEESRVRYWGTLAPLVIALYQHCSNTASNFPPCKLTILVALLSMLRREYHCKVLVKEGMVDFCICLPWYTQGEVQMRAVELVSMLMKSPDIVYQPPSLLNMCKAAVAVHYDCGLSCVINSTVSELARQLWINN